MRAAVQHRYGPPSVLQSSEVGIPLPGRRGDVLVQVGAAAVHPGDYFVMTREPYVVRLVFGLRRPRHGIPGRDLAVVVGAVGKADNLVSVPANVSVVDAGGVGSFAVQIAKAFGAEVTGVCSTRNVELVRSLSADQVVDYTRTDFTRAEKRYDVILDNVEAQPLAAVRRALTPTGTLIPNSGRGGRWLGPLGRIVKARVLSGFTRQQLRPFTSVEKRQDLLTLADLLTTGQVTPVIDRTHPLAEAAGALRYVAAGHTRGKVVITV